MRTIWFIVGGILIASCAGTSAPKNVPSTSTSNAPTEMKKGPILVSVRGEMMAADQSIQKPFESGDSLHSEDLFCYHVRVDQPAFIYVLQYYPNGERKVLFPNDASNAIEAHTETRIPVDRDQWFRLDRATGTEHIYIVASYGPLEKVDRDFRAIIDDIRTSPQIGSSDRPANKPNDPLPAPDGSVMTRQSPTSPKSVQRKEAPKMGPYDLFRSKGIDTVRITERGRVVFQGRTSAEGIGVLHFSFEHQ